VVGVFIKVVFSSKWMSGLFDIFKAAFFVRYGVVVRVWCRQQRFGVLSVVLGFLSEKSGSDGACVSWADVWKRWIQDFRHEWEVDRGSELRE
jgi:hypothetical protein